MENIKVKQIFEHVFETETYTEFDEEFGHNAFASKFDEYFSGGGCTAFAKHTKEGVITARNMDLYVSNKPSYVVHVHRPNKNKVLGLSYTSMQGPDYLDVVKEGVPYSYYKMIPVLCCDCLNEHGLYIETNMRYDERDSNGNYKYTCHGTRSSKGLKSEKRLLSLLLPMYLSERCDSVESAIKYVKEKLDVYTPDRKNEHLAWNFCFLMADKTGRYGILEIAKDEVNFVEGGKPGQDDVNKRKMPLGACQANFYITPKFAKGEKQYAGEGRYNYVAKEWSKVQTMEDAYVLINDVSYFQSYLPWCAFDNLSEYVGVVVDDKKTADIIGMNYNDLGKLWDIDYVKANKEVVKNFIALTSQAVMKDMANSSLTIKGNYWESTFTVVTNVNEGKMFVRFNECNKFVKEFDIND